MTYSLVVQVFGFHGTSEEAATQIVSQKKFDKGKSRADHWLGQGIYFYREDKVQALVWAISKVKNIRALQGQKAQVIEVLIEVPRSEFLNLDTREDLERFVQLTRDIDTFIVENNLELTAKPSEHIRCLYCDFLPEDIKLIQRTFYVESKYDKEDCFKKMKLHLHGVQLCVRNPEIIISDSIGIVISKNVTNVQRKSRNKPRLV